MGKDYILKMFYYCFFILVILLQIIRMMQFIVKGVQCIKLPESRVHFFAFKIKQN